MSEVKWIKIVTDIFDDEKILLIESLPDRDSIIVIWFKLLCLAGKQNNGGVFLLNDRIPYTEEMFATIFRRPLNTVRLALQTFEQFGMVEIVNNTVTIPTWGKHQNLEGVQARKEYMQTYMKEYRKRQAEKALQTSDSGESANSKCLHKCLRKQDVSCPEEEIEEDKERKKNNKKKENCKMFTPPSVDEVMAYCKERGNNVDAERFVDYYTANGWHVGKNPMRDWKAAVRTWERHGWSGYGYGGDRKQSSSIDIDEAERLMNGQ